LKLNNMPSLNNERGVAILLVMFVVTLLIILAAEFAFTTRMEITAVSNFREDIEGYYYALAGFQYALTEIIGQYDSIYVGEGGQVGFFRNWYHQEEAAAMSSNQGQAIDWPPLPERNGISIGQGVFDYIITDEQGRLNVNYLKSNAMTGKKSNREIFRELLVQTGVDPGEQADIIIDSIIDWTDENDMHMLNGAESDWYEKNYAEKGLSEPYQCKNDNLDTLDELLLIRGVTPEILYGSNSIYASAGEGDTPYTGIAPYITVYGHNRMINKDTAPPMLLRILDPDTAEEELEARKNASQNRKIPSRTFRIEVKGYTLSSRVCHYIMAIVQRSYNRQSGGGAEIIFWNDDAPGFGSDLGAYSAAETEMNVESQR
jgi:type II secretory pathway component PulK